MKPRVQLVRFASAVVGLSSCTCGIASEYGPPLRLYTGPPGPIGAARVEPLGGSNDGMWTAIAGGVGPSFAFDTLWVGAARSYAQPGREYWGTIDSHSFQQGTGAPPLSQETRNLYAAFRTGALFGNEVGAIDSCAEQQILQARIWLLEGTYADVNSLPDRLRRAYTDPANQSIVDEIVAMGSVWRPESEYVRVLNLWENYPLSATGEYQFSGDRVSQLIMIPAPAAALLSLLGLGATIWIRRRL